MAVPKKRTSKSRTNARKAVWKRQAEKASQKSLSLAKSILKGKQTSFIYKETVETDSEEQNKFIYQVSYLKTYLKLDFYFLHKVLSTQMGNTLWNLKILQNSSLFNNLKIKYSNKTNKFLLTKA